MRLPLSVESFSVNTDEYGAITLNIRNPGDGERRYLFNKDARLALIRLLKLPEQQGEAEGPGPGRPVCGEAMPAVLGTFRTFAVHVDEVLPDRKFRGPGPTLLDFKQRYLMTPPELRVDLSGHEAILVSPAEVGPHLVDKRGVKLTFMDLGREGEAAKSQDLELARGMGLHLVGAVNTILHF